MRWIALTQRSAEALLMAKRREWIQSQRIHLVLNQRCGSELCWNLAQVLSELVILHSYHRHPLKMIFSSPVLNNLKQFFYFGLRVLIVPFLPFPLTWHRPQYAVEKEYLGGR